MTPSRACSGFRPRISSSPIRPSWNRRGGCSRSAAERQPRPAGQTGRPQLEVVGLDPDARALGRADRKARRAGLSLELDRGFADELPYPDASFDRVLSAFMFHHLDADVRLATLHEVVRVLQPGGSFHLLDFGGNPDDLHGLIARLFRHSQVMRDNWGDRIQTLMREAGLGDPAEIAHLTRRIGRFTYHRAHRAG